MNDKDKEKIVSALKGKGVSQPCPRCLSSNFQIVGYSPLSISEKPTIVSVGGTIIPAVLIVCINCGFITMHALGSLGIMPKETHD